MEGAAAVDPRLTEARPARDAELLRRRLEAKQALDETSLTVLAAAFFLLGSACRAMNQPPAWVSRALDTGERIAGARLYRLCTMVAWLHAIAMITVLVAYHVTTAVLSERALNVVKLAAHGALVSAVMSYCVGSTEDWRGAAASFALFAVTALFGIGAPNKERFIKIGKVIGF